MDAIAELRRRLDNLIRLGTIAEVDHEQALVRVQSGKLLTHWLPWLSLRAGNSKEWDPPTEGEQVIIFSPSGELTIGVVVTGIFSDQNSAPSSNENLHQRTYPDGAVIEYNHEEHTLNITLPEGGTVNITGDLNLSGNLSIEGETVTHNDTNIGKTHVHDGVMSGTSTTGAPQ